MSQRSAPRGSLQASRRRNHVRALLVALLAMTILVGLIATSAGLATAVELRATPAEPALAQVQSSEPSVALPRYDPSEEDRAIGQIAPEVSGVSFDGTPTAIERDGRAKLIVFLAHWCPYCQREVPEVQRWLDAGSLPGSMDLISVATAIDQTRPNYPPEAWLAAEGWSAPLIVDSDDQVAQRYGLSAFPFWVFVDADGRVVWRSTGALSSEQLDQAVGFLSGPQNSGDGQEEQRE